jgi:uncharacterized protein
LYYFRFEWDFFSKMLTEIEFNACEPQFEALFLNDNPSITTIATNRTTYVGKTLLLEKETGSWCMLEPIELEVYDLINGQRLGQALQALPAQYARQLSEFVAQLYWVGLLEIDGRRFIELEVLAMGFAALPSPLFVIVPSEKCNLSCNYCSAGAGPAREEHMQWDLAKRTVDLIVKYPSDHFTVEFSGGEPFLEAELVERIINRTRHLAALEGKQVDFVAQTNGTLLTPSLAQLIEDLDIEISLSLDGDQEINDMTRVFPGQKSSYESVVKAMSMLAERGIPTGLICVISKSNCQVLRRVLEHFSSLGLEGVKFNPVFQCGRAQDKWQSLEVQPLEYLDAHRDYLDYVVESDRPVLDSNVRHMIANLGARMRTYRCMRSQCGAGKEFLTFSPNGNIYPCSRVRGADDWFLGNVAEVEDLEGLWMKSELVTQISERRADSVSQCRQCQYKRFCDAGCPLESYLRFGSTFSAHPWCEYYSGIYEGLFRKMAEAPQIVTQFRPDAKVYNQPFFP